MERKLIILSLGLTIVLYLLYVYRRKKVEHFQTNYLKDFHKYLDGLKTYNMDKKKKERKNSRAKKQKIQIRLKNVQRKNFNYWSYKWIRI